MTESNDIKIAVLQNQMNNVETKLDKGFEAINKKLDGFFQTADEKYATKESSWAERAIIWAIILIVGAVIITALYSLGLKPNF